MYNKSMAGIITRTMALCLIIIFAGCGSPSVIRYINPEANFSFIKTIAILPFNNLGNDEFAGERVRNSFTVDLMSRGVFGVKESGEVSKAMRLVFRAAGYEEGGLLEVDHETLKLLGEKLGVQAVILGSVDEYVVGARSLVTLSVRMHDTSSGIVLWQARSTASGASNFRKIVGLEETDRSVLTSKAVKEVLDTLL